MKKKEASNEYGEGFNETKVDTSFDETTLDSRTFTQVLQGTPASNSTPINYEKIILNQYDPLKIDSYSDDLTPNEKSTVEDGEHQDIP